MLRWNVPGALCVLSACLSLAQAYEEEIEVNYSDSYYNEITDRDTQDATPSPAPCVSTDLSRWDKLFLMLENSQMRENMLLQYADDIIKVEIGSVRAEIVRFVAQYGGSCGVAVETAGRRLSMQLEKRLRESMERLNPREDHNAPAPTGNSAGSWGHLEALLQQLLLAARTQTSRLSKLETSCLSSPRADIRTGPGTPPNSKTGVQIAEGAGGGRRDQEVTSPEGMVAMERTLAVVVTELKQMRAELEQVMRSSRQRYLPAGCETAILFPMRSRRIYAAVIPDVPLSLSSFTACLWAKPASVASNRTVLLSYGTRRNPYEIQLLFGGTSALFTVGGEAHLVAGRGVLKSAGPSRWVHLCGAWSSEQGLASLWADGKKVSSSPGVAEGHVLPAGGSLQLGQERNGCCPGSPNVVPGFEEGFDSKLAFAGKMTGVNVWDRVLSEEEIARGASPSGEGCEQKGNVVAWGLTEMVPHGGAQFID